MRFIPWFAAIRLASAAFVQTSPAPKGPLDQLIPWLLDEDQQLRGVPFSELIFDTTGKKVLPFEANNAVDQRVAKAISAACDETMKRFNASDSKIQNIDRINEVSSHFEDTLRELLNATRGLHCDFPVTAEGKLQRSGYPDLRITDLQSKRVLYLTRSFTPPAVVTAVSARFISSRRSRRIKCAMTQCISWSDSSMLHAKFDQVLRTRRGNSRDGILSIFRDLPSD